MRQRDEAAALLLALALVVSVLAVFVAPATAGHGKGKGNYTVNLPFDSDHYPRSANGHNASINHFAAGTKKAYKQAGAPNGIKINWVVIKNKDIDFSQCSSSNTAAYGIDRGNNDSGTTVDVDLLRYMEASYFRKHSIAVNHYDGGELAAPSDSPVEVYPVDEIVAHQGYKSQGGPCYGMPKQPGWYQIKGKLNGTNMNNKNVTLRTISHYFYICKCDSEKQARQKLGPPPSESGGGGGANSSSSGNSSSGNSSSGNSSSGNSSSGNSSATATPTGNSSGNSSGSSTPAKTKTPKATPTPTSGGGGNGGGNGGGSAQQSGGGGGGNNARGGGQSNATPTATSGGGGGGGGQQPAQRRTATTEPIPTTPTIADGPGFGAGLALVALLGAALLALRRTD